ncbi:MAG: 50S ribosomal protein L23 [Gammaproteobacteria bacterium]|nr:50S ribosomal protein L23 [Gammaproteobacteria bacterium]
MRKERLFQIINAPHVTEKTAASEKQIVFKVVNDATKAEIKEAVETLFDVKVESVRVVNIKGKRKNFRARQGKQSDVKKAYVGLAEAIDYEQFMAN